MITHPAYGVLRPVTPFASVLLENNPNQMTLDGTNTWVLRAPGADDCVIVDPGYEDVEHLSTLVPQAPVAEIVVTHHHADHLQGARWLGERVGAGVRTLDPALCVGAEPLSDGELIEAGGLAVRVWHTPGHTADSVCLAVSHDGVSAVLTGDTVLGRGTTVIDHPGGRLGDYLASLRRLAAVAPGTVVLPGHGPDLPDLAVTATEYLAHREQRLDQVRAALARLGPDASPRAVVEVVYADVDPALWVPAEWSVRAQLAYLRGEA